MRFKDIIQILKGLKNGKAVAEVEPNECYKLLYDLTRDDSGFYQVHCFCDALVEANQEVYKTGKLSEEKAKALFNAGVELNKNLHREKIDLKYLPGYKFDSPYQKLYDNFALLSLIRGTYYYTDPLVLDLNHLLKITSKDMRLIKIREMY